MSHFGHPTVMERDFESFSGTDPGWGTEFRRLMFRAACKYLKMDPNKVENIFMVGVHSMLQTDKIHLAGNSLDKVKNDITIITKQRDLIQEIKNHPDYKKSPILISSSFGTQLGGQRAKGDMWKQALQFWKWDDVYSDTWEMAFNELTWTVRSVTVKYDYKVDVDGNINFRYWFTDTLDLRPSWGGRSMEYNAICTVLGFLYHDMLGGSDELQVQADWTSTVEGE